MVAVDLDSLVGESPDDERLATALDRIPGAELPDALRRLVTRHGTEALPVLRRCLAAGRPDWAIAAASALATLTHPEAAAMLAAAEAQAPDKTVRTAIRRALYRLRQAGVAAPAGPRPPRPGADAPSPAEVWASAVDGTGSRGLWIVFESPLGERTLFSALVNDTAGILDFAAGPVAKKHLAARLRAVRGESTLPWISLPPTWGLELLAEGARRLEASGSPLPGGLTRWRAWLPPATAEAISPIYERLSRAEVSADPVALEHSAELLALPEFAGWFLDPPGLQAEALELLQAQESRLVVSDQVKAERRATIVERVIAAQLEPEARRRWQRRLEEQAWVLLETGRPAEARLAGAAALGLADPERPAHHIPFVRALVERSLEIAGEVALGRVPAEQVRRVPRPPRAAPVA
jgi:hypothetical protein